MEISNIKVAVRLRPVLENERDQKYLDDKI
jgi:hypothetical protein